MQGIEGLLLKLQQRQSSKGAQDGSTNQKTYTCPKCKDQEGYFSKVQDGTYNGEPMYIEEWTFCDCYHAKKIKNLFKSSQITVSFQKKGFQNFDSETRPQIVKDAHSCAMQYYKNFEQIRGTEKNSIALLGHPGSGKTHLLMAISNNLIRKGIPVMYFPFVEGFGELKSDMDTLQAKMNYMSKVPVLFIDDLFKPFGQEQSIRLTPFELKQLYAMINYRYLNCLPFLISSELTISQIIGIDEAIGSRISERCEDYLVVLKDEHTNLNYRLRNFEKGA